MCGRTGRIPLQAALAAVLLSLVAARPVVAEDWNQWGGAGRSSISSESSGWPDGWPPTKKWQKAVGNGCSSPIIASVDGTWCVFALGNAGGTDHVYCINAETGSVIWEKTYSCPEYGSNDSGYDHANYKGSLSTPTYDPATGYLYTFSCDGDLYCWNAKSNGSKVGDEDIRATYSIQRRPSCTAGDRGERRDYGFTSSPLIRANDLILEVAGNPGDKTLMAFNKTSGSLSWSSAATEPRGTTNGPVEMSGNRLAVLSLNKLLIIDAGGAHSTLASYDWSVEFACDIATPAVSGDYVILTGAYNQSKTSMIETSGASANHRWSKSDKAVVCTPVINGSYVYMVDGPLKCLELSTGNRKWADGSFGQEGTCLVADGDDKVIVWGGNKLAVYDCGASLQKRTEVTGILQGGASDAWPHLALGGGYIACRDGAGRLACYSLGAALPPQVSIDSFAASPATITEGASSTLSWQTSNADSVTLDGSRPGR
jgi:hypothetical protein